MQGPSGYDYVVEATKLDSAQTGTGSETAFNFSRPFLTITRAVVIFNELSLSGTDKILVQIGDSGGVETGSYVSTAGRGLEGANFQTSSSTSGFQMDTIGSTHLVSGQMELIHFGNDIWISSHATKSLTTTILVGGGSRTALDSELVHIRVTRSGTDTFDSGSVNVLWHGY